MTPDSDSQLSGSGPSQAALDACAREPIHIPGQIQSHGVLFVLSNDLTVVQASANVEDLLQRAPESFLGRSILESINDGAVAQVENLIRQAGSSFVNPFRVPIEIAGETIEFDGIAHPLPGVGTILELERDPKPDETTLAHESFDSYLQIIQRSLGSISEVTDAATIAEIMVKEVKAFTGFDRVMVYRFAPDFHGHVIAEACEPDMEPYLGLHYPASDIPPQARELYLRNPVRLLQDVDAVPSGLVPALNPMTGGPLDMSRAVLRAMSPVHVQYLKNMGVAASLSASLIVEGRLWGLIACHHRTPRFVTYATRATLALYAMVLSAQLKVKQTGLDSERIADARSMALSILTGLRDYSEPLGSLPAMLPRLVELFQAHGGVVASEAEIYQHGRVPESSVIQSLIGELSAGAFGGTFVTDRTRDHFPSLEEASESAAGMVAINLGGREWLLLFRAEAVRTITWAGNPNEAKETLSTGALSPRKSFTSYLEEVRGCSEPWPERTHAITAEVSRGILEILRNRNVLLARSNQDLRRFAGVVAHEVKNHLQTAIMALSLLEERLTPDSPEAVARLASHGKTRLTDLSKFTNDILAFAQVETTAPLVAIDLPSLVNQVIEDHLIAGLSDEVSIKAHSLPSIMGHPTQVRHLISNLVRNAILHGKKVEQRLVIEIGHREENGQDLIFVRDNGRGIAIEDRPRIFEYFYRGTSPSSGSGIGLAFCAQVVERSGHRLWLEDAPAGAGTTFCFTISKARSSPH